ncbi:hypothetical protein METP1_02600 [Methanosarcinales archaeon]|nr:hypothetical protein METP1_02600 [Methanosarcinales archaeon]
MENKCFEKQQLTTGTPPTFKNIGISFIKLLIKVICRDLEDQDENHKHCIENWKNEKMICK